jgi:hypothetical protein
MADQTTRRIERLEQQAQARGARIDASWLLDLIGEVYELPQEANALAMREDGFNEYARVMLKVYGGEHEEA